MMTRNGNRVTGNAARTPVHAAPMTCAQPVISPLGMGALLVYTLAVALSYPRVGVLVGTGLSFCLASVYLWGALLLSDRQPRRSRARAGDPQSSG